MARVERDIKERGWKQRIGRKKARKECQEENAVTGVEGGRKREAEKDKLWNVNIRERG